MLCLHYAIGCPGLLCTSLVGVIGPILSAYVNDISLAISRIHFTDLLYTKAKTFLLLSEILLLFIIIIFQRWIFKTL